MTKPSHIQIRSESLFNTGFGELDFRLIDQGKTESFEEGKDVSDQFLIP